VTGNRGRSPEEERLAEAGALRLNRIALRLIAEARGLGFGDDEGALLARAEELGEGVGLTLTAGGLIELSVACGAGFYARAELREDGVVLGGSISAPARYWSRKPEEFTPLEREQRRLESLAEEARRGKPEFHGKRYLRTVAAPAQPGADLRVLAAEIFDDGFYVDFTYDNEIEPELTEDAFREDPKPRLAVEDDLGTDYYEGLRGSYGGRPVSSSTFNFAPTPPAAATVLRITTDSGTVELDLRS
jgi:hypothetical protein